MSMWEPFTEHARRAIVLAQESAQNAGSSVLSSQHILAGVLREGRDSAAQLLIDRGITHERVQAEILQAAPSSQQEMIFNAEAKQMIEVAFEVARENNHNYIGSAHLLASIAKLPDSRAYELLTSFGYDPSGLLLHVKTLPGQGAGAAQARLSMARRSYVKSTLLETEIDRDPIVQLQRWIADASAESLEPNAMCIATADTHGHPSARIVLLRGLDARGLIFYTSYFSRKGRELSSNPNAAAAFYWESLERQVRVEGTIEQIGDDDSDAYFATRPRGHRLSAWASEQSEIVETREILDLRVRDYDERFAQEDVPRPHSWGGYLLRPNRIEFWQGRENRMHDRLEFLREPNGWMLRRLQP